MTAFGAYAAAQDYTKCKNGTYAATVISAKVVMENGVPKLHPESHKASCDVIFQLDQESNDGPIELKRRMGITYGKNRTTGEYAVWATMLEAFTHVACGDDAQKHIGEPELVGTRGMVRTKNVEKDGSKYTNIVDFEPLDEVPAASANRARLQAVVAQVKTPETKLGLEDGDLAMLEDEIPF